MAAQSFRDLKVWQKAVDLTLLIYQLTGTFPGTEVYGMSSQMRRASVSIASNIAEGSARGSKKDFRHFLFLAKGSTCELQTQLVIASRLQLAEGELISQAEKLTHEIGRMLSGLTKYLTEQIRARRNEHALRTEN